MPDGLRKRLETAVLTPTRPDPDPDRNPEDPMTAQINDPLHDTWWAARSDGGQGANR